VAGNLWFENDTGVLYIYYTDPTPNSYWVALTTLSNGGNAPWDAAPLMDDIAAPGVSAFFARGDHVHPSDTSKASTAAVSAEIATKAVRYDAAQVITEAQQTTARKNIYAAPFDALAYNGLQINGSMAVSQDKGGATSTFVNSGGYVVDGFVYEMVGSSASINCLQQANSSVPGFQYLLTMACTVANPLSAAGDRQVFSQPIEGYRWSRLGYGAITAQSVTIGFWISPNISGTMAVSIRNTTQDRCYVVDVPVTAGSFQFKTVTIPGCGDGAWNSTNGLGAFVSFCFGSGSTRKVAPNTWVAAGGIATANTTNFYAAPGTIYMTGVVVLPGIEAPTTTRSPLIMRPYDQELVTCKRYWRRPAPTVGTAEQTTFFNTVIQHEGMRAMPALTIKQPVRINANSVNYTQSVASVFPVLLTPDASFYQFQNFTGLTPGASYLWRDVDAPPNLDARL
jgi:hypothetical protein